MADIISQLNLTEKELEENKERIEEIVELYKKIESFPSNIKDLQEVDAILNHIIKHMDTGIDTQTSLVHLSFGLHRLYEDLIEVKGGLDRIQEIKNQVLSIDTSDNIKKKLLSYVDALNVKSKDSIFTYGADIQVSPTLSDIDKYILDPNISGEVLEKFHNIISRTLDEVRGKVEDITDKKIGVQQIDNQDLSNNIEEKVDEVKDEAEKLEELAKLLNDEADRLDNLGILHNLRIQIKNYNGELNTTEGKLEAINKIYKQISENKELLDELKLTPKINEENINKLNNTPNKNTKKYEQEVNKIFDNLTHSVSSIYKKAFTEKNISKFGEKLAGIFNIDDYNNFQLLLPFKELNKMFGKKTFLDSIHYTANREQGFTKQKYDEREYHRDYDTKSYYNRNTDQIIDDIKHTLEGSFNEDDTKKYEKEQEIRYEKFAPTFKNWIKDTYKKALQGEIQGLRDDKSKAIAESFKSSVENTYKEELPENFNTTDLFNKRLLNLTFKNLLGKEVKQDENESVLDYFKKLNDKITPEYIAKNLKEIYKKAFNANIDKETNTNNTQNNTNITQDNTDTLEKNNKKLEEEKKLLTDTVKLEEEKKEIINKINQINNTNTNSNNNTPETNNKISDNTDEIFNNYRKEYAKGIISDTDISLPLEKQLDLLKNKLNDFINIFGEDSDEYKAILDYISSIEEKYYKKIHIEREKDINDAFKAEDERKKAAERARKAAEEAQKIIDSQRKSDASDILNSVSKQETLSGQRMPLADQLQYMEDQLRQFVSVYGTENDEYIAILKRVRQIEQQIETERHKEREQDINDAFRAEDERKKAAQEAQRSQQQAYQQILSSVRQISNNIQNVIRNILNTLRRSIQVIKNLIIGGFRTISRVVSGIKRIIQLFGNFGNRVKGVNNNTNLLKGSFTELKSKIDLLVGAYNKLFNNDYINSGRKLLQSIQTLNITLGKDLTENTIKWSKELERAFGISASGLISDLQGINAVLYGMGMNSQGTELAGRNLLAVGQTLAGITGYDLDTVLEKIESGMKGMTQSIDDLGLSVRESEMNAFLKDLKAQGGEFSNIATSFQNLTEQQRVYVRYAALMTQFRRQFDAEDYVRSLDSITGRLIILESRFRSLKATIGDFALQLLDRITIPLATFITFIENKIKALAKLFGIDLEISSGMNKTADGAEKASKNLGDVNNALEDIEQTADKAKGGLDAFDHISNISSSTNSNSSPFDYSKLLAIAPDYAKELEDIAKLQDDWLDEQWRKFKEKIKAWLEEIKQKISDWWFDLTGRIINWDIIGDNLKKAWENIKTTFENIKRIIKEIFRITVGLVGMILDDLNFTQLLVDITGLFASISGFVATFLETVEPILFDFYNNYLKKYVVEFGDFLHRKINEWIGYFDGLTDWAKSDQGKKDIEAWFDKLGKFIDELVKKVKGLGVLLKVLFAGEDSLTGPTYTGQNNDHLVSKGDYTVLQEAGIDHRYVGVASSIHNIFADILAIITDIGKELGKWWENEGLDQFKSTLERIDEILSENKENIVSEVSTLADSINKIKEAVLQKILDILEWIAQHPEEVNTALTKISDVIVVLVENIDKVVAAIVALKAALVGLKVASLVGNATKIGDVIGKLFTKAAIDKTVENTVSKAGSSIAGKFIGGIGKGISTGYSTITTQIAGIGGSAGLAIGVASIGTAIADIAMGAKNVKREFDGIGASWNGMLAGIKTGIDTTQITLMAHEAGRNLRENYGLQLKQSNIDAVVRGFEAELRATYNITDEEVKKLSQLFEHDLKDAAGVYMYGIINDTAELEQQTKKTEEALASRKQKQDELKNSTIQYRNELNQTKEVQASADFDTASHMKHMGEMKLKQDDYKKSLEDTKKAETEAANSTKLSNMSLDDRKKRVQELNNENAKYRESKRQNAQATSNTTKTEVNAANSLKNSVNNTNVSVKNLGNSSIVTANKAVRAFSNIKNAVDRVNSSVKLTIQNINRMHNGQNYTWATNSSNINRVGVTRVKSYMGHANGGVPSKGSIFMANENGMPELVSNFGGYTGVANQGMILEAMKAAIGSSVYDAVTTAMRTNNAGESSKPNIEICKQGMFVGDDNAIRKLAVLLDNTLRSSNGNISNTGFSLT